MKKKLYLSVLAAITSLLVVFLLGVPELRLVGTNPGEIGSGFAIIENTKTGVQDLFDLDRRVFGSSTLVHIEKGKIILDDKGELVTLTLSSSHGEKAPILPMPRLDSSFKLPISALTSVVSLNNGKNALATSRSDIVAFLKAKGTSLTEQLNAAQTTPAVKGVEELGIVLNRVRKDDFAAILGLVPGDIIRSINGQIATTDLLQGLVGKEGDVLIEVERSGKTILLGIS